MSDGEQRPGSGVSHQTIQSHHSSGSQHTAPSGGSRSGAGTNVVVQDMGGDALSRYKLMFTGPDGHHHHRVSTQNHQFPGGYVGEGARSEEMTSNLGYMFRMPQTFPFPKGKKGRLGEIGGEIEVWNIKKGL